MALAAIYDGGARGEAARTGGVGLQTVRDWVLRFNARGPDGLIDTKAPGNPPKLDDSQRRALSQIYVTGLLRRKGRNLYIMDRARLQANL